EVIAPDCIVLSGPTRAAAPVVPSAFFALELDGEGRPPNLGGLERADIARLLEFAGGNRTAVARLLGVSYPTIAKKISDYGLGGKFPSGDTTSSFQDGRTSQRKYLMF